MPNPIKIAIALGGNLGGTAATFELAAAELAAGGVDAIRRSGNYRTSPVGCAPGTPDFLNAALTGVWLGGAAGLLELCRRIEVKLGRPADHGVNRDRTVDLDIILFGDRIIREEDLVIPHPRARERLFVLEPLAELAPDWEFPDEKITVKNALSRLRLLTTGRDVV